MPVVTKTLKNCTKIKCELHINFLKLCDIFPYSKISCLQNIFSRLKNLCDQNVNAFI